MVPNKDLVTTIFGAIGAAVTAAQPILQIAAGNWSTANILQLVAAISFAVLGYCIGKRGE